MCGTGTKKGRTIKFCIFAIPFAALDFRERFFSKSKKPTNNKPNMTRSIFLSAASAVAAAAPALAASKAPSKDPQRPNIVYIMSDDHSFQTIGAYGHGLNSTPNIDRIAAEGITCTNNFVSNSISGPCRAVILTGKFSHKNGFYDNSAKSVFDGEQQTFPKLLQQAGYQTAIVGKWHLVSTPTGFDYYSVHQGQGTYYNPVFIRPDGRKEYPGYATDLTADHSLQWLEGRDKSKPFCLMMHFKAPHRNWMPAPEKMAMYEDTTFPLPETFWDDYAGRQAAAEQKMSIDKDMNIGVDLKMVGHKDPEGSGKIENELGRMSPAERAAFDKVYKPLYEDFKAQSLSGRELAEWKYQRYMRDYLKVVSSVDDNVGRLVDYLKANDLWENTIVIYTSDQGFYMGEHGWFDKRFMYEESFRTPLIISWPAGMKQGGKKCGAMLQNIDLAPTFIDLAGMPVPQDIQGESFKNVLTGKQKQIREDVYYHYYEYPVPHAVKRHYGVRNDRYKLIHFYYDIDKWELYDLKKDPREMHNVIDDPAYTKVKADMTARLKKLQVKYDDLNPTGNYDGWAK